MPNPSTNTFISQETYALVMRLTNIVLTDDEKNIDRLPRRIKNDVIKLVGTLVRVAPTSPIAKDVFFIQQELRLACIENDSFSLAKIENETQKLFNLRNVTSGNEPEPIDYRLIQNNNFEKWWKQIVPATTPSHNTTFHTCDTQTIIAAVRDAWWASIITVNQQNNSNEWDGIEKLQNAFEVMHNTFDAHSPLGQRAKEARNVFLWLCDKVAKQYTERDELALDRAIDALCEEIYKQKSTTPT